MTMDSSDNSRKEKWKDGTDYDRYIQEELTSFRKKAWKEQICKNFDGRKKLHILDVGTGPGFLSCILSEEGHLLTGIDASEGMLACAEKNAEKMGVHPRFLHMDVNHMEFADESFDVIVSRNVTWTLEHPESVYREFYRILKKNGILLTYDANWHRHFFDEELYKKVREHEKECLMKYGREEVVAEPDYGLFETAPLTKEIRPQWDIRFLQDELSMSVKVEQDIGSRLYEQWEKELYRESPLFEICAIKRY
ncbi:class I SAM-dependent methyltransferase [Ruminococcus sp. AF41-9]|nr:class I SAM-dependent methyltransferase [Ruminococcus sp. AF41-9]